jgi:hypothetical protein
MPITHEQFSAVCDLMEQSTLGIQHLCKQVGISKRSFFEFKKTSDDYENQYTRSKNTQLDNIADEIIDIADDGSNDFMTIVKGNQEYEIQNKEWVNRSRLRVDSRKWLLSKLNPKKYGDKLDLTTDGDKINIPSEFRVKIVNPGTQHASD